MPPRPQSDSRLLGLLYHFLSSSASAMVGLRGGGVGCLGSVMVDDGLSRTALWRWNQDLSYVDRLSYGR